VNRQRVSSPDIRSRPGKAAPSQSLAWRDLDEASTLHAASPIGTTRKGVRGCWVWCDGSGRRASRRADDQDKRSPLRLRRSIYKEESKRRRLAKETAKSRTRLLRPR